MTNVRTIHVDWYSQRPPRFDGGPQLAYQGDHLSNMVVFDNAPVLPNYYLLVEMKLTDYGKIVTLPPIMLEGPYWVIPNYYTQICQIITYQVCERTETGDYEHHSAKFHGTVLPSVAHLNDPTTQEPMFDPYMAILDNRVKDIIDEHGEIVIDEETAAEAINSWLDEHPEATTTVQDGAISEAKLATALKPKIINAYVTPEMYGAVGDGVADDTTAIQSAMDYAAVNGIPFKCASRRYAISAPLNPKRGADAMALYDFNGAWIKAIESCSWIIQGTEPLENLPSFVLMNINMQCNGIADGIDFSNLRRATFENVVIRKVKTYALYSNVPSGQVMFFNVRAHMPYDVQNDAYFIHTNADAWFIGCYYQNFKYGAYVTGGNVFINNLHGYPSPYNYVGSYGIRVNGNGRVSVDGFYPDSVNYCILCTDARGLIHVNNMQNYMNLTTDLEVITPEVMSANPHTIVYTDKKSSTIIVENSTIWQSVTNGAYDDYSSIGQGWICYGCTQRQVTSQIKPKEIPQLADALNEETELEYFTHWNGITTLKAIINTSKTNQFILRAPSIYGIDHRRIYPIPGAIDGRYLSIDEDVGTNGLYAIRVRNRTNPQIGDVVEVSFPV